MANTTSEQVTKAACKRTIDELNSEDDKDKDEDEDVPKGRGTERTDRKTKKSRRKPSQKSELIDLAQLENEHNDETYNQEQKEELRSEQENDENQNGDEGVGSEIVVDCGALQGGDGSDKPTSDGLDGEDDHINGDKTLDPQLGDLANSTEEQVTKHSINFNFLRSRNTRNQLNTATEAHNATVTEAETSLKALELLSKVHSIQGQRLPDLDKVISTAETNNAKDQAGRKAANSAMNELQQQLKSKRNKEKAKLKVLFDKIAEIKDDIAKEERIQKAADVQQRLKTIDTGKLAGLTNEQMDQLHSILNAM
ncbi:hypothetical protein ACHAQD_009231 [Fusarium lateritium]